VEIDVARKPNAWRNVVAKWGDLAMHRGDCRGLVVDDSATVVLWTIAHAVPERSEGHSSAQG